MKIIEFMVEWGEVQIPDEYTHSCTYLVKDVEINQVGAKELILSKCQSGRIDEKFAPILIPLLGKHNEIEGT